MADFFGICRYGPEAPMSRHRHPEPYMAVVLEGGYLEAGDAGRLDARPGDVLLHGPFDAHLNCFHRHGATVINLPLENSGRTGFGRIENVDEVVKLAESNLRLASSQLLAALKPREPANKDWPDLLAAALIQDPDLQISDWADQVGLSAPSVSRGFARSFGISPKRFRLEVRVRRAIRELGEYCGSLTSFAVEQGFFDQAHFIRSVAEVSGQTPSRLRAKFIQSAERQLG